MAWSVKIASDFLMSKDIVIRQRTSVELGDLVVAHERVAHERVPEVHHDHILVFVLLLYVHSAVVERLQLLRRHCTRAQSRSTYAFFSGSIACSGSVGDTP